MTYPEALEFLESLTDFERLGFHRHFAETVGLDSARHLLDAVGNPHLAVPAVHIAGTKGKGSTAAMLERVLREAGYRTGLFTSPHLVSFRERVQVNGQQIPQEALAAHTATVRPEVLALREAGHLTPCTFFEAYLAVAALYFAHERVDIAIYETGLGGRLDATNLLSPLVCGITTIGFDHMGILGNTLEAIAREKAGIAKPGVPLVVARGQAQEAMRAIQEVAARQGAQVLRGPHVIRHEPPVRARWRADGGIARPMDVFVVLGEEAVEPTGSWPLSPGPYLTGDIEPPGTGEHGCPFPAETDGAPPRSAFFPRERDGERAHAPLYPPERDGVRAQLLCSLLGAHQAPNLGVALGMLEQLRGMGYTISGEHVDRGLRDVRWPGRFDIWRARPWVVVDVAHNLESAQALARALPEYLEYDRLVVVVGMSDDKDIASFAGALAGLGAQIILTQARVARALPPEQLRERAGGAWDEAELIPDVSTACARAVQLAGPTGAVCVTGSFYVVGEAMARFAPINGREA